jgi:protein-disulfide isomerase
VSRKGWLIGGAIVVVVAVVVALIVVSVSGGDSSGEASTGEVRGVQSTLTAVRGIPQAGLTLGKASAPVTVREFIDPQCPVCKAASETTVPAIIKGPVADGTAKLIIEPLTFLGSDSSTGALAIAAAANQDRGVTYTEILLANQGKENSGWVSDALLADIAGAIPGLDVATWETDRKGTEVGDALFATSDRATANNVNATPTFVISGPGGNKVITGASEPQEVLGAIEDVS